MDMLEDNAANSIHNFTWMTMTDCEAYVVPIIKETYNN